MDHGGHDMMGGNMTDGMMMYFHFSSHSTILFKGWTTNSWQTMLGSCVAVFVMAFLYETLKVAREYILQGQRARRQSTETTGLLSSDTTGDGNTWRTAMLSRGHTIQTLLHVVQLIVSYFLMLIFMTYNVWLCLAVTLGAATGYFLFSWRREVVADPNDHCH